MQNTKTIGCGDALQGLTWPSLHCFSSTGEASSPEDYHWLMAQGGYIPIMEYCGGTEIGGAFLSGCMLQPQSPSTFSTPTIGAKLAMLLESGEVIWPGVEENVEISGEIAPGVPMLGASQHLLNKDHFATYYEVRAGIQLHLVQQGWVWRGSKTEGLGKAAMHHNVPVALPTAWSPDP